MRFGLVVTCVMICVTSIDSCKIFADLTTNRYSRKEDGTLGLWSYFGKAKESHAIQTSFVFNGDLIEEESFYRDNIQHSHLATFSNPLLGLTSDTDEDYLEYLILQSLVANIDGFVLEWGYEGHPSDYTLQMLIKILKKPQFSNTKFCIGINWCDHWLKQHLNSSTPSEMVEKFWMNGQYLLNSFFIKFFNRSHFFHHHPVILLFGGGITAEEFSEVLRKPFDVPFNMKQPIWIGNYLNMASTQELRNQWINLINGTFAWVSHTRSTPPQLSEWDRYSLPEDTVKYQKEVCELASSIISNGRWCYWMASANPGEDNRGCAGWGQTLKYVPRTWKGINTYDVQWQYNLNSSANAIILPTLNDYSEATVILPTTEYNFEALISTLKYGSLWKKVKVDYSGIKQPAEWFTLMKKTKLLKQVGILNGKLQLLIERVMQIVEHGVVFCSKRTFQSFQHQVISQTEDTHVSDVFQELHKVQEMIINKDYASSYTLLKQVKLRIEDLLKKVPIMHKKLEVPSAEIYPVHSISINETYLVNHVQYLYLQMKDFSSLLRKKFFKGMLTFDYLTHASKLSILRVDSSTNRKQKGTMYISENTEAFGDFKIVCRLKHQNIAGKWQHAAVELFKENQAWDHNGHYSSDVIFIAETKFTGFFIRNISLSFSIYG